MIVSESQVGQTDANDNMIELHISVLLSFVMRHPLSDIILSMSSENHVSNFVNFEFFLEKLKV